ncbi:MAG TPA: sulfotransferase [Dyella sp.]|uniref:sulfotransferase n=1 Tax=Dyella sp. TaxID=1869338 RepID=UPI002D7699DB|nr:sulfotransferase [Dyella sp.]HET6555143.1 sulfotransferase [Dyella sp.]
MKLPVPFIQLPLQFDASALAREIAGFGPEHWREHPQKYPGNLWLPLVSAEGDPDNDSFSGPMRPTSYLLQSPYLRQVMSRIGGVWGRSRLMKLTGQAEVSPHFDVNYYWRARARVHVPILTKPSVRFMCGEAEVNMAPGECWIFDTWRMHRVINANDDERIHLVADTVGSDDFSEYVRLGRMPGHAAPDGWQAELIEPSMDATPPLRFESVNLPVVMSPWELREHIGFLLRETRPSPLLEQAHQITGRFFNAWQALWAEFGTDPAGWPAFRQTLNTYEQWLASDGAALRLVNDASLLGTMRLMVFSVAIKDRKGTGAIPEGSELRQSIGTASSLAPPAVPVSPLRQAPIMTGAASFEVKPPKPQADPQFERPVFILSSPRAGSTLLFETLSRAPGLFTIGRESHALIEGIPELSPGQRGFDSNRLDASAATRAIIEQLRQRFFSELRDRDGKAPVRGPVRMLEKTPKNALRVPFLARVFPEAHFVYLYRDPRETLSSMIEAWESGRFGTYPKLPGWKGTPWSLLLVPGWRDLNGRPLQEIVAAQWEATTRILLDDLETLPADRVHAIRYDAFLADPSREVALLCRSLGLGWDQKLDGTLPLSRYTVSEPSPGKWRRHGALIDDVLAGIQSTRERADRFATR